MAEKKAAVKKTAAKKTPAKSTGAKSAAPKKVPAKKAPAKKAAAKQAEPTHEQIAELARKYYHEHGGHGGSAEHDWLRAERELKGH